ncbi:hypothetical protein QQ045_025055 [Rhodiola kirilowii]
MSQVLIFYVEKIDGWKHISCRCVRDDHSAVTVKLFYLCSGTARIGFWIGGREYLLPVGVVLKALSDTTDHELYSCLTCCYDEKNEEEKGAVGTQLIGERAKIILDEVQYMGLLTRTQCIQHIGEHVQPVMQGMESEDYLVFHATEVVLVGRPNFLARQSRFTAKSRSFGAWTLDNDLSEMGEVKKIMERHPLSNIGASIESLLKNGYLASKLGLDLQQGLEHAVVGTDLYVVGINDDVEDVKEEAMEDVNRRLLYLLA